MHVAIEVLELSFVDRRFMPEYAPLADLLNNGAFCYGPAIEEWRGFDVAKPEAVLVINGKEVRRVTAGTPGGHPRRLLTWLANHAAERGRPLKRGISSPPAATPAFSMRRRARRSRHGSDGIGEATLQFA